MRTLIFATLFLSLPALAGSLDDFVNKSDEEIAALKLTRPKLNSLLAHSSKSITIDSVVTKAYHSDYDPSYDPGPRPIGDDVVMPISSVKCTLKQVSELKGIKAADVAGHKVAYHIQVSRIEDTSPQIHGVWVEDNGNVTLIIGQSIENNYLSDCKPVMSDEILSVIRKRFPDIERSRAQELAPANEDELIKDLQNTSFKPAPHQPGPKIDIDI